MNYYTILKIKQNSSKEEIKKSYHKLILEYHPDKNNDVDHSYFSTIQEAYETLSNDSKRKSYDEKLNPYSLTEADYEYLSCQLNQFMNTVEYKFCMSLFCKLPKNTKEHLYKWNKLNEFLKKMKKKRVMDLSNLKTIDITELFENIDINLNVDIRRVYECFCCEILIYCKDRIVRLFISEINQCYRILNNYYFVNILIHLVSDNYYIYDNKLHTNLTIDIYDLYYKRDFVLILPNKKTIQFTCDPNKNHVIENVGLYREKKINSLYVNFVLDMKPIDHKYRDIFHEMIKS